MKIAISGSGRIKNINLNQVGQSGLKATGLIEIDGGFIKIDGKNNQKNVTLAFEHTTFLDSGKKFLNSYAKVGSSVIMQGQLGFIDIGRNPEVGFIINEFGLPMKADNQQNNYQQNNQGGNPPQANYGNPPQNNQTPQQPKTNYGNPPQNNYQQNNQGGNPQPTTYGNPPQNNYPQNNYGNPAVNNGAPPPDIQFDDDDEFPF